MIHKRLKIMTLFRGLPVTLWDEVRVLFLRVRVTTVSKMRLEPHTPCEGLGVFNKLSFVIALGLGKKFRYLESRDFSNSVSLALERLATTESRFVTCLSVCLVVRLKRLFLGSLPSTDWLA